MKPIVLSDDSKEEIIEPIVLSDDSKSPEPKKKSQDNSQIMWLCLILIAAIAAYYFINKSDENE